jgi:hypothetical protein
VAALGWSARAGTLTANTNENADNARPKQAGFLMTYSFLATLVAVAETADESLSLRFQ